MIRKKYISIAFGVLFIILSLTTILADIPENSPNAQSVGIATGVMASSINFTFSTNYFSRTSGPITVGMYSFDEGFGRFGILKNTSAYCGNKLLEMSETCDNGTSNWIPCIPACESTCTYCDTSCTFTTLTGGSCGDDGGDGGDGSGGTGDGIITECSDTCSSASSSGICTNSTYLETKICGNFDSDDCLEWGSPESQVCSNGCEDGECTTKCESDWECGEWGECTDKTDANSVLLGGTLLGDAHQERRCVDRNDCTQDKIETISCTEYEPIETRTTEWCDEEYVELFDPNQNKVVGKMKQKEFLGISTIKRVDISFEISDFSGFCAYCFDKVQNHDETGLDCGGPSCPRCITPKVYINWIIYVIILSWTIFGLLILLIAVEEKDKLKAIGKGTYEKTMFIINSAKFKSMGETDLEIKILASLRRYLKLPFLTPKLKPSRINLDKKRPPYTARATPAISEKELRKNWLTKSLRRIRKRKRHGFLGEGENIEEARKGLRKK